MNTNDQRQSIEFNWRALVLLTNVLLVSVGIAPAKDHKNAKAVRSVFASNADGACLPLRKANRPQWRKVLKKHFVA